MLLALVLAALQAPTSPTVCVPQRVERRTALDRPGTHHASVTVRLVDAAGEPVRDASVLVFGRPSGWGGGLQPVARTLTDADGRARLADVSSEHDLSLHVEPPRHLRPRTLAFEVASGGHIDLGELRLERNGVLRGILERVQGDGTRAPLDEGWIRLERDEKPLAFCTLKDGRFLLEDFALGGDAQLAVRLPYPEYARYARDVSLDELAATGPRFLQLRIDERKPGGELELLATEPSTGDGPLRRIVGRLLLPDGTPAANLPVSAGGGTISDRYRNGGARTMTDGRGGFVLETRSSRVDRVLVEAPGGSFFLFEEAPPKASFSYPPGPVEPYVVGRESPFELRLRSTGRIALEPRGLIELPSYSYLTSRGWLPCDAELAADAFTKRGAFYLRASVESCVPRVVRVQPQEDAAVFDFEHDGALHLFVAGERGEPVTPAKVDLVHASLAHGGSRSPDHYDPPHVVVDTLELPGGDWVSTSLGGPVDGSLTVYVYAEGFEPAFARMGAGETVVRLAPRSREVTFDGLGAGETLRVRHAGSTACIAVLAGSGERTLRLAPGAYDVAVEADGELARGRSFRIDAVRDHGRKEVSPLTVDLAVDERPTVVLRLPELPPVPEEHRARAEERGYTDPEQDRWTAFGSRRTPPGATVGAAATTWAGGPRAREPEYALERAEPGRLVLRLAGTGRWQVHAASEYGSLAHTLFREVEVGPGERVELVLPPLDATLRGGMRAFDADNGFSFHGFAGPRLVLLGDEGPAESWGVVCFLPPRVDGDETAFELEHLPPGAFHAYQHLDGRERGGWGGLPLELVAGETTTVADFAEASTDRLNVTVIDARGEPVTGAVLRVRDRMHEAWSAFRELPTTGVYAHPSIPAPPSVRVAGEPVTLPAVRAGRLELVLELADRTVFATCDVALGGTLEVRLPR